MNSTQIACFLEVAKSLSFARAAQALYTSQPVISYQIKSLESELELRLFTRTNRNVALTAAGEYLYERLEPVSREIRKMVRAAQEIQRQQQQGLRILVRRLADYSCLTKAMRRFSDDHPLIPIDILTHEERRVRDLLSSGEIQLAFCYGYEVREDSKLEFLPLDRAFYYVLVNRDHPLTAFKYLTFEDLTGETLILMDTELQKNKDVISAKELERLGIGICYPSGSFDSMLLAVEAGAGFTVLPCGKAKRFSGLIKIPLKNVHAVELGLAWAREQDQEAAGKFVDTAAECWGKKANKKTP